MGAGRGQIIRQLLIESFAISALGAALGLVFAIWGRDALVAIAPAGAPRFEGIGFDWRVMAFTFGLAALTTLLFGLWPAWQAARTDINAALQAGSFGSSETKTARRSRDWLVIGEVALTLLLLSAAGLVLKSFAKMQSTSLGFEPADLYTVRIELPYTKYDQLDKTLAFTNGLLDEVRRLPGVQAAALSANPPMLSGWQLNFMPEGAPPTDPSQQPGANYEVVAGDYFQALKINLIRGRMFNEHDRVDSPPVVIIDQALADMTFKGQDPIGKRILVDAESDVTGDGPRLWEIVGLVPHVKMHGYGEGTPTPAFFFPQAQIGRTGLVLHVRASGNVKRLEKPIREIVNRLDPNQPLFDFKTMDERVAATWATHRLLTFLLTVFAGLALLLAAVGLYGVLAYTAFRRLREIAVRLALGASPAHIRGLVMGHGLRLFGVGIAVGALAVAASAGVIRSFLFGVSPLDAQTYLAVGFILSVVTILAAWLPARRACRVNPIVALRSE
jgi:putative ABC transport system permease protein